MNFESEKIEPASIIFDLAEAEELELFKFVDEEKSRLSLEDSKRRSEEQNKLVACKFCGAKISVSLAHHLFTSNGDVEDKPVNFACKNCSKPTIAWLKSLDLCGFYFAYNGFCHRKTTCEEHGYLTCARCKKPAQTACALAGSWICSTPLCLECKCPNCYD